MRRLLASGMNPRLSDGRETPLHAAARRGPLALVETLIAGGALEWQPDTAGRTALEVARRGRARERAAIVALLDRSTPADPAFRAAVDAIHAGDVAALERLLDAEPRLLRDRAVGPEAYRARTRHDYFRDPKLFWFIAYNPTPQEPMPSNITEIARVMIDRGVDKADLDYTLGLLMTSSAARERGHKAALTRLLLAAGAETTRQMVVETAAYGELDVLRTLIADGEPMNAPVAAALGDDEQLRALLASAGREDVQTAFGLAVINGRTEAARIALDAGADVNAFLPVHAHCTALHQAAAGEHVALIELLLARGARTDQRDTLWDSTPLDWARHLGKDAARRALEPAG